MKSEKPLFQHVQQLQAGLPLLQQQYSQAAAAQASERLKAADPFTTAYDSVLKRRAGPTSKDLAVLRQIQDAHYKHLEWFLAGISPEHLDIATAAGITIPDASSSSSSRSSPSGQGQPRASPTTTLNSRGRHMLQPPAGELLAADVYTYTCLVRICQLLSSVATAKECVLVAVRPALMATVTGTFSLLAKAAELLLASPQDARRSWLGPVLFDTWQAAAMVRHGREAGFKQPGLTPELPVMAELLHSILQQQAAGQHRARYDAKDLCLVVLLAQEMVEGSAAAAAAAHAAAGRQDLVPGSSVGAVQEKEGKALGALQQEGPYSSGPDPALPDGGLSPAARARVMRCLWRALTTAIAALRPASKMQITTISRQAYIPNSISSTHSSLLPKGVGYTGLQLTWDQAGFFFQTSVEGLLQLAAADVPQQHLSDMETSKAWVQQVHSALPKLLLKGPGAARATSLPLYLAAEQQTKERLLHKGGQGTATAGASSSTPLPTPAAPRCMAATQFMCWPQPPALTEPDASDRCRDGSSSSSRSSSWTTHGGSHMPPEVGRGSAPLGDGSSRNGCDAGPGSGDALGCARRRLDLLAAAVGVWWPHLRRCDPACPEEQDSDRVSRLGALLQLLALLVQRVQAAPLPVRAAFLHSPAGSIVLTVLSHVSLQEGDDWRLMRMLALCEPDAAAAGEQQEGKQSWRCELPSSTLVGVCLLPGLLLQPVCPTRAGVQQAGSDSGSNQALSTGSHMERPVSATTISSSGSSAASSSQSSSPPSLPCAPEFSPSASCHVAAAG